MDWIIENKILAFDTLVLDKNEYTVNIILEYDTPVFKAKLLGK
jgi:hypothetical protein